VDRLCILGGSGSGEENGYIIGLRDAARPEEGMGSDSSQ
jgi:hypothetical protein